MFILTLTYKAPLEEVMRLLPVHYDFLNKYYESGHFIASGPQVPRTGGVIICKAESRPEVEQIISEDPFNEIADYQVTEFEPNKFIGAFEALMK